LNAVADYCCCYWLLLLLRFTASADC
jgi:hypothetical protein